MSNSPHSLARASVIIVALHFLILILHSAAHINLHIEMNLWQSVYIILVIVVLPLVSGVLLWRMKPRMGFLLLLCSMLGALMFGGYYHFIAAGMDNVASVGAHSWGPTFRVTAVLLALTESAGVLTWVVGLIKK